MPYALELEAEREAFSDSWRMSNRPQLSTSGSALLCPVVRRSRHCCCRSKHRNVCAGLTPLLWNLAQGRGRWKLTSRQQCHLAQSPQLQGTGSIGHGWCCHVQQLHSRRAWLADRCAANTAPLTSQPHRPHAASQPVRGPLRLCGTDPSPVSLPGRVCPAGHTQRSLQDRRHPSTHCSAG